MLPVLTVHLYSQEDSTGEGSAFTPGFLFVGEFVNNFRGGIETGSRYLGLIDASLHFNLDRAGLINGGELYLQFEHTHGGTPTADLVGDFQAFSNIENGNYYFYLYEFWYKNFFGNLSFQAGVIDLNVDFLASDNGGLYANSSFGIIPAASMNIPVPIFPKNALGVVIGYDINKSLKIQTSVFDGDPASLDDQENGLDFQLSSDQGFLSVTEFHVNSTVSNGIYKLGFAYHSGTFVQVVDSSEKKGNMAIYSIIDKEILIDKLKAFLLIGWTPEDYNYNSLFFGGGINLSAPLFERDDDMLGLAFAYAHLSNTFY